jgi:hypothetical protein
LADTSVRSSSSAAKSTARSSAGIFAVCAVRERSRISIHSFSVSHSATWSKAAGSKSAPSSRLTTVSTFLLNSAYAGVDMSGVLVPHRGQRSPRRRIASHKTREARRDVSSE